MSAQGTFARSASADRPAWTGAAFIVEAMLLLLIVIGSLAVFTQLFAASAERAEASAELSNAVAAATSVAEQFAADPQGAPAATQYGDLQTACAVTSQPTPSGVLYRADIAVTNAAGDVVYAIDTSKYVSDGGSGVS